MGFQIDILECKEYEDQMYVNEDCFYWLMDGGCMVVFDFDFVM